MGYYISNYGEKKNINDSRDWGNYPDSTENAAISGKKGTKQNTGFSQYWCANNIYDFAGNCSEWSQEACGSFSRAIRGGSVNNNAVILGKASDRSNGEPTSRFASSGSTTTRPTIFIE